MKKTLALVLALAMVFSTITVAFAEDTLGEDAQTCADLGMLKGEGGTVDAAYTATAPTRLQAAVMFLRLKGLEAEALAFTGEDNFADGEIAWAEGANLIAYLKANPQLGWIGDGTSFNPEGVMTAQAYYKVMLEALGYKQTTDEVAGDFAWTEVLTFAASVGLSKVAEVENFTVNDLAIATVEALKVNVKDTEKTLADTLVEAGVIDEAAAVAAGLVEEVPTTVGVAIDDVYATGNAVVVVEFEDDVDPAAAGNIANYAIEGLEVSAVSVADTDKVVLDTAAMTAGKLYTLTVGESSMKFSGVAKVSGSPEIVDTVGEDIEEVVITFSKNIDFATGSDVANYSIAGVEIAKAEVDEDEVTLTTVGLKNKTKYTVKATNIKSVDGATKKSDTDSFTTKFDTSAPKIDRIEAETNQRVVVYFNEEVTEESAENLANYSIKVDEKDGDSLEIISVEWDSDDEDFVSVVTEPMEKKEDYVISVNGIVDQRKAANTMTRASSKDFKGIAEDEDAPKVDAVTVLSPTKILVKFKDASRIDEASATNPANYELEGLDIDEITVVENEWKVFRALLTVEDMDTNKAYDFTIDGVADEFGNTMEEVEKTAKATSTNIAAVGLLQVGGVDQVYATGENTVVVVFDNEVDEDSAENISNYKIDNDIGAPTKAVYEKKASDGTFVANSVTLTVADLVNGFEELNNRKKMYYELTIDGVLDLAGNELFYEAAIDVTPATAWDKDAPELDDAEAIDQKVVALTFDEQVKFKTGAKLLLLRDDDVDTPISLNAYSYDDDDTVVEFAYTGTLDENIVFTVYNVVYDPGAGNEDGGITDLIGNYVKFADIYSADNKISFNGTSSAHDAVEMDSYYQKDARQFEVTMDKEVTRTKATTTTGSDTWAVEVKGTDNTIVRLTLQGAGKKIKEVDYNFDFTDFLEDKFGYPVAHMDDTNDDNVNDATILTGEYEDDEKPYIEEVVAVSRNKIKVVFNERMDTLNNVSFTADFELRNYDLDEVHTISNWDDDGAGDAVLYLIVNKPLEARYEYELKLVGDIPDHAGLNADKDTFYFDGTNLK